MKTWKLAAIFMALVSVLTLSSCSSDDEPRSVVNTQWEKIFTPDVIADGDNAKGIFLRDIDWDNLPVTGASIKLDFISKTQATFTERIVLGEKYFFQVKYILPFNYNTTTGAVMLKFSDRESLAIEHNLPDDEEIGFAQLVNSLGQVDWDKNTLSLTLVDEEVGTHPVVLTKK